MLHGFHHRLPIRPRLLHPYFPICQYHQRTQSKSHLTIQADTLDFYDRLLLQSSGVHQLKKLHAQIILTGLHLSSFLSARLISIYSSIGLLADARSIFSTAPSGRNAGLLLWNSILRANLSHGYSLEAFHLYCRMRELGVAPDGFSFPLIIRACTSIVNPKVCRIVHGHATLMGFQFHLHVANELIGMYGKIGQMDSAYQLLNRMPRRNVVSWNVIISGYAANYDCRGAFEMFGRMELEDGLEPNLITWTSLLSAYARCGQDSEVVRLFKGMRGMGIAPNAEAVSVVLSVCGDLSALDKAKEIHGYVVRNGFEDYVFVKNSLICMYGKHGQREDAKTLFSEIKIKNLVTWNALISSYAAAGLCDDAFEVLSQLEKLGAESIIKPNVVSWSAVIGGFASNGRGNESLELFRQMQQAGVDPNSVTIATILSVCAELAAFRLGREIHGHVIRSLMNKNILVENGLLHMYAKCGCLRDGCSVFERIEDRDLISWNSMIAGYGMHGFVEDALNTFYKMIEAGFRPDGITFVALLSACSHTGLVTKGRQLYDQMIHEYMLSPQMEHYACMVDLLGRAGLLQEASEFVKMMPIKPNACVWGALLNSCRIYKNMAVAEETFKSFGHHSEGTGSYMLLSNIYAECERWEDSAKMRVLTKMKCLKKSPGQSWIEVKKKIYLFSAGNLMQPGLEKVYKVLEDLGLQMEDSGYIPDETFVFQYVAEEEADIICAQ